MFTNELGPLHGDHGERSTPLRVKKYVAHGWRNCGEVEWEEGSGRKSEGNSIRMRSKPRKAPSGKSVPNRMRAGDLARPSPLMALATTMLAFSTRDQNPRPDHPERLAQADDRRATATRSQYATQSVMVV